MISISRNPTDFYIRWIRRLWFVKRDEFFIFFKFYRRYYSLRLYFKLYVAFDLYFFIGK